jgi:hypothetical protein
MTMAAWLASPASSNNVWGISCEGIYIYTQGIRSIGNPFPSRPVPATSNRVAYCTSTQGNGVNRGAGPALLKTSWEDTLDETSNVLFLDYHRDSANWVKATAENMRIIPLSPSVLARLYLMEGVSADLVLGSTAADKALFRCHVLNTLPYDRPYAGRYFFAKWSRLVFQDPQTCAVERKMAEGRPYNPDIPTDPKEIGLDHDRYEKPSCIPRPCDPLGSNTGNRTGDRPKSLWECASFHFWQVDTAVVGMCHSHTAC